MHVGCVCEYTLRVCMCGCTLHLNGLAVADIDKLDDPQASHRMLHCRVRCIDMPQMCDVRCIDMHRKIYIPLYSTTSQRTTHAALEAGLRRKEPVPLLVPHVASMCQYRYYQQQHRHPHLYTPSHQAD